MDDNDNDDDDDDDDDVDSNMQEQQMPDNLDVDADDELEPLEAWIQRVTHRVELQMKRLKLDSWIEKARRLKWKLAQRIACMEEDRWPHRMLLWRPDLHYDGKYCKAHRRQARPKRRWTDDLSQFTTTVLQQTSEWHAIA